MANKKTDSTKNKTVQKSKKTVKVEKTIKEENKKEKEVVSVPTKNNEKKSKGSTWIGTAKRKNVLTAVLIMLGLTVLLTWIFPPTSYSSELAKFAQGDRTQVGLFDIYNYIIQTLSAFAPNILYMLVIGGFYGVLYKTGAYRILLDKIVNIFKGKEKIFLLTIIVLISVLTSICGASIALLMIVPLIISIIILMGYDRLTAGLVTIGSLAVGLIGTTLSYTLTDNGYSIEAINGMGVFKYFLNTASKDQLIAKIIILIIGIGVLVFNVLYRVGRNKAANNSDNEKIFVPVSGDKVANKKTWPLVVIIDLAIFIILLSLVSWTSVFNVEWFLNATKQIVAFTISSIPVSAILLIIANCLLFIKKPMVKKVVLIIDAACAGLIIVGILLNAIFKVSLVNNIFGFSISKLPLIGKVFASTTAFGAFPIFGKILGVSTKAFENWSISEISVMLVMVSAVIALVYKIKFNECIHSFIEGAKRAIKPAAIITLIYIVTVIAVNNPFTLTIVKQLIKPGLNVFTMSISAFIASIFHADIIYSAQSVLPYATTIITSTKVYPDIALIWQVISGFAALVAPTSIILMATLSYLHVSFIDWFKATWKFILELLLILMLILTIVVIF